MRKPGKENYTTMKVYHPIALLNTLGKTLESVMAQRFSYLVKTHKLLPDEQMGARKLCGTETALELLTEQVHTIWGCGRDKVASILSLDVAGAFSNVSHPRLLHNLRKRQIPTDIIAWVESFLSQRTTTMVINRRHTGACTVRTGIPQRSPLSSILFLFYNVNLIEWC